MKFNRRNLTAVASGIALAVSAMAAQAAEQPTLETAGPEAGAVFTGGATINGGASYLAEVPATEALDLVATIKPAAADVGKTGSLVAVLDVPGIGLFTMISGGFWLPYDGQTVPAFATRTLEAEETVVALEGLVGIDTNLTGLTLGLYVGYFTDGTGANLTYTNTAAAVTIAEPVAAGCPTNTTSTAGEFKGKPVCVLSGRIESNTHLNSVYSYLLDGQVTIGANEVAGERTRLTIDAGTTVFSQQGLNFLVIDRNGQIHANGSQDKPIVFTYEGDDTATRLTRGQWGGIIINGSAPINEAGGEAEGEGSTGIYGGTNPADNSGSLTYVQVKYAGQNITETNELNGIAFQAVGNGTNIDYVQVHNSSDDGIEFFGGTADARHLLLTGNEDDALDWTFGWNGRVQFVVVKQADSSEHCIEADNNDVNNDAIPRSNPTISNMTCVGDDAADGKGIRLREGTAASLSNFVMTNFADYCIDIDQAATFANTGGALGSLNGQLAMRNSRLAAANCSFDEEPEDAFTVSGWFNAQINNANGGVDLGGDNGWVNGVQLNAVSPAIPADSFFEDVDHIGAVKDESTDWTGGWSFTDF